jgi:hypothetical protein
LRRNKTKNSCDLNLASIIKPPGPSVAVPAAFYGMHRKPPLDNQAPEKSRAECRNTPKSCPESTLLGIGFEPKCARNSGVFSGASAPEKFAASLADRAGVAQFNKNNGLDWQTSPRPFVESQCVFPPVANPATGDPPAKKCPAAAATANRAVLGSDEKAFRPANNHTDGRPAQEPVGNRLHQLAREVRRIGSGHRCDPERIAMAKDEIAHELVILARRLDRGGR